MASSTHYGGTFNPNSPTLLSPKPAKGITFKSLKRMEDIVRLEQAGFPERAISAMLGISVNRLRYIKKSADFLNVRARIMHGIILDHDSKLSDIKEQRRELLKSYIPEALQVIVNVIQKPAIGLAAEKMQLEAARDLLDREGTFAKITRTEVKPVEHFDFEKQDKEAQAIISAVRGLGAGAPSSEMEQIEAAVSVNKEFANSATISAVDQQAALDELEFSASKLLDMPVETDVEQ